MSTTAPWTLKNQCVCGHHHDTHFKGAHNCLGLYCDCTTFRKSDEPEPKPKPKPK